MGAIAIVLEIRDVENLVSVNYFLKIQIHPWESLPSKSSTLLCAVYAREKRYYPTKDISNLSIHISEPCPYRSKDAEPPKMTYHKIPDPGN